jgi:biopolymer transport protein ExbB
MPIPEWVGRFDLDTAIRALVHQPERDPETVKLTGIIAISSATGPSLMSLPVRAVLVALALSLTGSLAFAQAPGAPPAGSQPEASAVPAATAAEPQLPNVQLPGGQPSAAAPVETPAPQAPAVEGPRPVPTARVPRELSPWSMFMSADIVVKAVMVSLAFASLVTWTIFLGKTLQLFVARRRVKRALGKIAKVGTLAEAQLALGKARNVVAALLAAATAEVRLSADTVIESGIKERADSRFAEILRAEQRVARTGMGLLATIGATAPFVGLFGTVWGIMNSFIGISKAQTTNLAVVAPGIAEALLATAIGLVAAIPAVIFYNHFARGTRGYLDLAARASGAVGRLLSRDLDRANRSMLSRAAE